MSAFFLSAEKAFSQEKFSKAIDSVLKKIESRSGKNALEYIKKEYFVPEHQSNYPVNLSEEKWKEKLNKEEYYVLRKKGTERPFTGKLDKEYRKGIFYSAATGEPLFSSEDKFDSKTGWPSFTKPIKPDAVRYILDKSFGITRIEVVDSKSGSHLGHVFEDGPAPTGLRYCMNSVSMIFVPEGGTAPKKSY